MKRLLICGLVVGMVKSIVTKSPLKSPCTGKSPADLERKIEQGKAKMQAWLTPKPKDSELVTADKQQAAIQKLVKETTANFGKG